MSSRIDGAQFLDNFTATAAGHAKIEQDGKRTQVFLAGL
jgi:hypothetical protein